MFVSANSQSTVSCDDEIVMLQFLLTYCFVVCRYGAILLRPVASILGIEYELRNDEVLSEKIGSAVVVANHQSYFDVLGERLLFFDKDEIKLPHILFNQNCITLGLYN